MGVRSGTWEGGGHYFKFMVLESALIPEKSQRGQFVGIRGDCVSKPTGLAEVGGATLSALKKLRSPVTVHSHRPRGSRGPG